VCYLDENLFLEKRFRAKKASFLDSNVIKFKEGWWWKVNSKDSFQFQEKGETSLPHTKDFLILPEYLDSQTLSMKNLKKIVENLTKKGIKTTRLQVEYYKKISDAFACFVLVILGLPFAFQGGRKGSLYGISIALCLSLVFIVSSALMKSVGQMEWLDPFWSALAPSFLFTIIGFMALLKIKT
jgi:lipopolysaccharide export system permease protein